jgi:hypothetical protein
LILIPPSVRWLIPPRFELDLWTEHRARHFEIDRKGGESKLSICRNRLQLTHRGVLEEGHLVKPHNVVWTCLHAQSGAMIIQATLRSNQMPKRLGEMACTVVSLQSPFAVHSVTAEQRKQHSLRTYVIGLCPRIH